MCLLGNATRGLKHGRVIDMSTHPSVSTMSHNVDDPLRGELADIRAAAQRVGQQVILELTRGRHAVCDPEASVATLVDLLATEHRNLQARLVERVASIVAHHDAEARRFDCAADEFDGLGNADAADRCRTKAGHTRTLAAQIARGDDLRGDK